MLVFPSKDCSFIVDTDASNQGIGAVLSQVQDGNERVIVYYSKSLTKAEQRYCVTRKELLAVVASTKHFHHYLYGRKYHGALRWLMNFKNPEGQTARWLECMSTYDFDIQHRPGKQHGNADGLSRKPCDDCKQCDKIERNDDSAHEIEHSLRPPRQHKDKTTRKVCDSFCGVVTTGTQSQSCQADVSDEEQLVTKQELRDEQMKDNSIGKILQWKETSTGMIERANRTIENMLAMFVDDNQRDWDICLPCYDGLQNRCS